MRRIGEERRQRRIGNELAADNGSKKRNDAENRGFPNALPGTDLYIHKPMIIAIGNVIAIVNVAHELPVMALTIVIPSPAVAMTTTKKMAIVADKPEMPLISVRAVSARDLPSRRTEANRMMKSCTAPARHTPMTSQIKPGRNPNCAARTGPTSGPAPVIPEKCWPNNTHFDIG